MICIKKNKVNTKYEKIMAKVGKECFIQPAIAQEHKKHHEGYTHKLLGVPQEFNLSHAETLLKTIVDTDIGKIAKNPLKNIGKRSYLVTLELKRHVNFALNLIRISEGKSKQKKQVNHE